MIYSEGVVLLVAMVVGAMVVVGVTAMGARAGAGINACGSGARGPSIAVRSRSVTVPFSFNCVATVRISAWYVRASSKARVYASRTKRSAYSAPSTVV